MMTKKKHPSAPPSLNQAGSQLWDDTVAAYELSAHELSLLGQACRTLDICEGLWRAVKSQGYEAKGAAGHLVVNPLLQELRQQRGTFASLIRSIGLPEEQQQVEGVVLSSVSSLQQRKAGASSWAKAHGR